MLVFLVTSGQLCERGVLIRGTVSIFVCLHELPAITSTGRIRDDTFRYTYHIPPKNMSCYSCSKGIADRHSIPLELLSTTSSTTCHVFTEYEDLGEYGPYTTASVEGHITATLWVCRLFDKLTLEIAFKDDGNGRTDVCADWQTEWQSALHSVPNKTMKILGTMTVSPWLFANLKCLSGIVNETHGQYHLRASHVRDCLLIFETALDSVDPN